ncbi:restriction endonuclease subunit S, partial [Brachyspira hampsonii]
LPLPKGLEEKNKDKLIKEDRIKKEKNTSEIYKKDGSYYERVLEGSNVIKDVCIDNELPFNIPDSWVWVRLGNVAEILRGGSPRPINKYLTTSNDGINWIKISDAEKNGKYINSTRERIIKEGINRSRFVKSGDFLLTNSMSFGRPYILNIDGCIHDGWLVITKYKIAYNREFLFYLLSSNFAYYQFCKNVSGSVVQNLSIDKVANSIFPLPPLDEQKR